MGTKRNAWMIAAAMAAFVILAGCSSCSWNVEYSFLPPDDLGDGIEVGTLDEADIDPTRLGQAVDRIRAGRYGEVHSMLIYRGGNLVFEEYFPGHEYRYDAPNYHGAWVAWDEETRHNIFSAGKSVTSACIGVAIEQGFIESVDQSVFDYLPDHQHLATDGKDAITIEHLLTMTSGLKWTEWGTSYSDMANDLTRIAVTSNDPIASILEMPLISEPGTEFTYSGGGMTVLGEIIRHATGLDIEAFASEYLFAPMGIVPVEWRWSFNNGVIYAGGEQLLTPREMLKFGLVYLNDGVWDGERIVSEQWVQRSSTQYGGNDGIRVPGSTSGPRAYSYSWWTRDFSGSHAFFAAGWGGQEIIVLPDLDAIVVFTGGNFTGKVHAFTILKKFVLPAFN